MAAAARPRDCQKGLLERPKLCQGGTTGVYWHTIRCPGSESFRLPVWQNRKARRKAKQQEKKKEKDHQYTKGRKFLVQDTKKSSCPARCVFREICRFPAFQVSQDSTSNEKDRIAEEILVQIRCGEEIKHERVIITCLATTEDHTCNTFEEITPEPIDSRLSKKIQEMCRSGVTSVVAMRTILNSYVKDICTPLPHPSNRRFYPVDKSISNCMYRALKGDRKEDQERVLDLIKECEEKSSDFIFCRLKSNEKPGDDKCRNVEYGNRFLFVYQSEEQRRLLMRYGSMVFMDATYKTTLYDLPLFLLAVKTNVDYQVVGTFVTEDETVESITEALTIFHTSCADFKPVYFMTDFDEREISALENVFSDATVLLCDFHRNQAWERWTKRKDNSMGRASDIIKYLHQLANAPDPESFDTALQKFVDSDVWQGNVHLQQYCQRVWFPHKKRWAKAYRSGKFEVIAGTNNGLESSHRTFKKFFLHGETNFNLSNMLRSLIKDFFPSRYRTYVEKNQLYSGKFRNYSEDVPPYLRSRPKNFIKHCLESLELSKSIERSQVESKGDGIFFINGGTKTYTVNIGDGDSMPSCECNDWYKSHMPCKHMVAAITTESNTEWHLLSPLYMQSVYCTVDDFEENVKEEGSDNEPFEKTVHENKEQDTDREKEQSLQTSQVMARDVIKKLLNITYNINDKRTLKHIQESVCCLIDEVKPVESVPLLQLPKRLAKKKYRKRLSDLRQKNERNVPKGNIFKSPVPDIVDEDNMTVEVDDFLTMEEDYPVYMGECAISEVADENCMEYQDSVIARGLVEKLWSLQTDLNTPVAKPYGILVSDTDIRSLRDGAWLTDNILDCYLNMLCTEVSEQVPKKRVVHFVSSLMSSIVSGTYKISPKRGFRHKLSNYENVIGIFGRAGHWTLIIADIPSLTIYFYNPCGEEKTEENHILLHWKEFIQQYNKINTEELSTEWTITSKAHTLQEDSYNCGVFCLLFADKHIKNELGMEHITAHDLMKCRRRVAEKVMVFEDFMTDCCPKCGFVIEDDNKMQCGNCRRMYHFKPYCIEDSVVEMQDEDENFTCKLCALNFWPKVHPQVTKEASLEHTVHWTSKDEIQKKLKECRQLDTDVVFIDNIETSTGSGDWSAKQTKVDEKTSPVFSHRKTRLLKRKRQRSSFIYPPVTKKSRTYCVCNTVDDGRLYWNCDLCEKWYHPSCLGRDDKEEPEVFVCNTCKDAERKGEQDDTKRKGEQDDKAVTYAIPDIIKRLDEEEDAPDESDYFVDAETACKHMEAAITRASFIVSADKKNRHGRELFMARSNCFRLGGRSKYYGYGYGVFSFQARECVEIHLKKKFLKYSGIYITNAEIMGLQDKKLQNMFQEDRILAEIYLSEVLAMEGLAAIFQSLTKCGYEDADKELKKFQNKSKFKAQKDAIEQIASVKKELEKKYSPTFVSKTSPEDKLL